MVSYSTWTDVLKRSLDQKSWCLGPVESGEDSTSMSKRRTMRPRRPTSLLVLVLLPLVLLGTGPASAQEPAPVDTALVDQYKETIPTASGPKVSGGSSNGGGTPLPPAVVTELRQSVGEEEAKRLEEV